MNDIPDTLLQRMASVVLSSGVGVVRGRADAGPRWANDAFLAMSGYARCDLAWLSWAMLAADGVIAPAAEADGIAPTVEREFLRKDGSGWPVVISRGVDPTDADQLILFVVDLTATRVAEAARRAADRRYARFFEVSNVAFWTADAQGRATLTSTTTAERLRSEVELSEFEEQAQLIHPDDRAFALATWQGAVDTGRAYDIEVRARGLDGGDFRWTRLRAFPDIVDGRLVSWYGTTEDVHERHLVAEALTESEQRFKRLADDIPVMVWLTDADNKATWLSKSWYDYTGQSEAEALGFGWFAAVMPDDQDRVTKVWSCCKDGQSFDIDFRVRATDGGYRWMVSSGRSRRDAAGALIGYVGCLTDIHARTAAEHQLADVQLRLSRALDGTGVGVWEWDGATDSVTVSGSALSISGIPSSIEEYREIDYRSAVHPDDRERLVQHHTDYVEGRIAEFACEVRIRRRDGGWVWVLDRGLASARDADGRATRMVGTLTNIDEGKRAAELLRWTVDHDALTGLGSRTLFHARLAEALEVSRPVALALLDIDDFKAVNDEMGHAAGDALLAVLAQRLTEFARPNETVARLGGDEFTLIIPDCGDAASVSARLEVLRSRLAEPFVHDGQVLTCRSSIGVSLAPEHGNDATALLRTADIAMYTAKANGRGAMTLYHPSLGVKVRGEAQELARLRHALDERRVVPRYEPVVRLSDSSIAGFEVLAHIAGSDIDPIDVHDFDALQSDTEVAARLGEQILEQVLADFAAWRQSGIAPEFVSINVSLAELRRADYAERLLARLDEHGISPELLRIEIVEAGLNGARPDASDKTLETLSRAGMLAGLDKFGVGAASMAQLARLPLAAVKIDRQLVQGVATVGSDQTIVRAITGLGISFGVRVVALGVETEDQAAALKEIGCTYTQGRWSGEPLDAAAVAARLKR